MSGRQYLASEDSALLRKALRPYSGESCLEIGAGNGGNLIELTGRFELAVGTDLQAPAMDDWKGSGASFVLADAATCLKSSAFDLVAFNPPYLPVEQRSDVAVAGGEKLEVPLRMLREALRVVRKSGKVVFLLNDEADLEGFRRECERLGFAMREAASERLFFEKLTVYVASRETSG
jgi:release factor glutamine methyltransferase